MDIARQSHVPGGVQFQKLLLATERTWLVWAPRNVLGGPPWPPVVLIVFTKSEAVAS